MAKTSSPANRFATSINFWVSSVGRYKSDHIKEQWYCTSQQTIAGQTRAGKPKAIRLHQNARLLKAIWMDIDVKDDPKCYGSIEAAVGGADGLPHSGGFTASQCRS